MSDTVRHPGIAAALLAGFLPAAPGAWPSPGPALAAAAAQEPGAVAAARPPGVAAREPGAELVLYADGRALVREAVRFRLEPGEGQVVWSDPPRALDPSSVLLTFFGEPPVRVVEQLHLSAVAGLDPTLSALEGSEMVVVTERGELRGTLLSVGDGSLTLRLPEDSVALIPADRVHGYRVARLPEGWRGAPSMAWTVRAERGGPREAELAYLTGGLGWSTEYTLVLAEDEASLRLDGWADVHNASGRDYPAARVLLVAGRVGRAPSRDRPASALGMAVVREEGVRADGGAREERAWEYRSYALPRRLDLGRDRTVRVRLTGPLEGPVLKRYRFVGGPDSRPHGARDLPVLVPDFGEAMEREHAAVWLLFSTARLEAADGAPGRAAEGTGAEGTGASTGALPEGRVRIYRRDPERGLLLVGEDRVPDTPPGDSVRLLAGRSFDLVRERERTDFSRPDERTLEEAFRLAFLNGGDEAVVVEAVERMGRWREWEVVEARLEGRDAPPDTLLGDAALWRIRVPAGGRAELVYRVRYRWEPFTLR